MFFMVKLEFLIITFISGTTVSKLLNTYFINKERLLKRFLNTTLLDLLF